MPDWDESYCYVPAVIFWGPIPFRDTQSGSRYDVNLRELGYESQKAAALILNAVDGSVVNVTNE